MDSPRDTKQFEMKSKVKGRGLGEHYDLPWKYELKSKNTNLRIITERKWGSYG